MTELSENIQQDITFDTPTYLGYQIYEKDQHIIEGNGYTLNANGQLAHILHIHASNVIVDNLSFLGGDTTIVKDTPRKDITFRSPEGSVFEVIDGGAVLITGKSAVTFTNCTFEDNHALMCGGAVSNQSSGIVTFRNCTFKGNTAGHTGSAIDNLTTGANLIIEDCTFEDNESNTWNDIGAPHGQITIFPDTKASIINSKFIDGSIPFDFVNPSDVTSSNNEYGEHQDWSKPTPVNKIRKISDYLQLVKKLYWLVPKTFGRVYYRVNK